MSFSMVSDIPQFGEVPTKVKEQPESLKLRTLPGDDRRKSINYSVTTVVRELLEGLAKSAESALSVNQGDSTDVAQQVAAIFASAAESALKSEREAKKAVTKKYLLDLTSNSDRIAR